MPFTIENNATKTPAGAADIHRYDGKLDAEFAHSLCPELHLDLGPVLKPALYRQVMHDLKSETARRMLTLLYESSVCDSVNKLDSRVLFEQCLGKAVRSSDFLREFEAQLIDLETGTCPQGRCTRMFQLLLAFPRTT